MVKDVELCRARHGFSSFSNARTRYRDVFYECLLWFLKFFVRCAGIEGADERYHVRGSFL